MSDLRLFLFGTPRLECDGAPVKLTRRKVTALLAYLEKELSSHRWDLKHIYRLILNSRTYQQSPIPRSSHPDAESLFACYPVRRLDAEVLIDALCWIRLKNARLCSPMTSRRFLPVRRAEGMPMSFSAFSFTMEIRQWLSMAIRAPSIFGSCRSSTPSWPGES